MWEHKDEQNSEYGHSRSNTSDHFFTLNFLNVTSNTIPEYTKTEKTHA